MPLRDRLIGAGVVLALVAILAGTVVWRVGRDVPGGTESSAPAGAGSSSSGPPTDPLVAPSPDDWPPALLPLVAFVERERGGPFAHPVPVSFLEPDDYEAAAGGTADDITEEDRADVATWEEQLRALGLLRASDDLLDASAQMYGQGTLAYYDSDADDITVLGTDLDVAHEVTLVHELTHAWQDQHGFLDGQDELDDTRSYTLQALAEGDASRIEDAYVAQLSDDDFDDYVDQSHAQGADVDLGGVPDVLLASFGAAYALGGPFATVLADEGGNAEVDRALATPPPAEADLILPNRYLDGVQPVDVPVPAVPEGAETRWSGPLGAVTLYLTLAERIDPRDALDVVDHWAGDASVVYAVAGRACTAVTYRADSPGQAAAAVPRFQRWADTVEGHDATVEAAADAVTVRSCEAPAGQDVVVGRSQLAVEYPALRLQVAAEVLDGGGTLERALCAGTFVVDQLTVAQVEGGAAYDPDVAADLGAKARRACPG